MYLDRNNIRQSLFGLVGFYNPSNPNYPALAQSLLESRSGKRVNEVHPLIMDIENIDQSVKNFSHYNYDAYDNAVDISGGYSIGDKVIDGGIPYEYINQTISSDNQPPNINYWRPIDELSDYLIKQMYAGIDETMDTWINDKKIRNVIKSIYDQILLYNGQANYRDLVTNTDNFVGLRIRMKRGERSLVTIINKIGHQFSEAFDGLDLYIYHASQQDPIATHTINHTKAKSSQWTTLVDDNILRYISDEYDAGGDFFIGYNQSQLETLGAKALKMEMNWNELPCDCDRKWSEWYKQYSNFIDVIGFEIPESEMIGGKLSDLDNVSISVTNNYGLNLNISTMCDIGWFIKQEERLFADAINNTIGLRLLSMMANNTRGANQVANQVQQRAMKEIYHSSGVWGTVFDKAERSMKALSFDLSGLSEECFPCDDNNEISISKVTLG